MANRITSLVIDCVDPETVAAFWCAVLDWQVVERDETGVSIGGSGYPLQLDFLAVPDAPKGVKNRLHIDVNATDRTQEEELGRLRALGAVPVDIGQGPDVSWHVLADPEGNEFCLLRSTVAPV